jgi:hypothetical protein
MNFAASGRVSAAVCRGQFRPALEDPEAAAVGDDYIILSRDRKGAVWQEYVTELLK